MIRVKFNVMYYQYEHTTIRISIFYSGKRYQYSTGISLPTKQWDRIKQRAKSTYGPAIYINQFLKDFEKNIEDFFFNNIQKKIKITDELVLTECKRLRDINKQPAPKEEEDYTFNTRFYAYMELRKTDCKPLTIKHYVTTFNTFKEFQKTVLKHNILIKDIDKSVITKFKNYLLSEKKKLANNSILAMFKDLKVFLKYEKQQGNYDFDSDFRREMFESELKNKNKTDHIALTEEEVQMIIDYDTSNNIRLDRVKDLFLIQCFTALRFSDIKNLKTGNIDLAKMELNFEQIKTGNRLIIPITPKIAYIFEKYKLTNLPIISNQKYNVFLKELCKHAGIDTEITLVKHSGNNRTEETHPKYDLISSHTGRRTMITIALTKGMLPENIMKISGHTDKKSFDKYIKLTQTVALKSFKDTFN